MPLTTLQSMSSYTDKSLNIDNRIVDGTASSLKKVVTISEPTNHIITIDPNVGSMFDVYDNEETAFEIRFAELNDKYTMTGSDISISLHLTDPSNTVITWPSNIVWESNTPPSLKTNNMLKFSTFFNTSSSTWNCTYDKEIYISKYNLNTFTTRIARIVNGNGSTLLNTVSFTPGVNNYTNGSSQQITEYGYASWGLGNMQSTPCIDLYQLTIDNNSMLLTLICATPNFPYNNNGVTTYFATDVIKAVALGVSEECMLEFTETRNISGSNYRVYTAETENLEILQYMMNSGSVSFSFYADPNRMN